MAELNDLIYHFSNDGLNINVEIRPLVKCKDCVYRFVDGENVRFNCCELNHNKVQSDDWFCADGERRDDGQIQQSN